MQNKASLYKTELLFLDNSTAVGVLGTVLKLFDIAYNILKNSYCPV